MIFTQITSVPHLWYHFNLIMVQNISSNEVLLKVSMLVYQGDRSVRRHAEYQIWDVSCVKNKKKYIISNQAINV